VQGTVELQSSAVDAGLDHAWITGESKAEQERMALIDEDQLPWVMNFGSVTRAADLTDTDR
jgi:hypothetical protein